MSFGAIGGGIATAVVGSALGGSGGSSGGQAVQQTTANPFKVTDGMFNTKYGADGKLQVGMDDRFEDIEKHAGNGADDWIQDARNNQNADMASAQGLQFLQGIGSADPQQIANQQFNQLNPLLQQQQEQDFLNMESRLFSQGQLGSGGFSAGQNQLGGLFDSQEDSTRKLMYDSLGLGLQTQAHMANMGNSLSMLDPAIRGAHTQNAQGLLNMPLAMQTGLMNQASVMGGLAGASQSGAITNPGIDIGQAVGAGLINSGVNGITSAADGLFQPNNGGGSSPPGGYYGGGSGNIDTMGY